MQLHHILAQRLIKLFVAHNMQSAILEIIEEHALMAQQSEYDRTVCILAISNARKLIQSISITSTSEEYLSEVIKQLSDFQQNYHDPDGQYTSGKGTIGALLGDLIATF